MSDAAKRADRAVKLGRRARAAYEAAREAVEDLRAGSRSQIGPLSVAVEMLDVEPVIRLEARGRANGAISLPFSVARELARWIDRMIGTDDGD